jgi:hypothetical protein
MAVSQADIDALNAAIASGERVVVLNGQSVTYRSIDDLIKAKTEMLRELENQQLKTENRTRRKQTRAYYAGRGYC